MDRKIIGFQRDLKNDWVAALACGHGQHVRHNPPFENRPWVTTADGRASKLGVLLNCKRCDELELPDDCIPYKRTAVFHAASVPAGLTSSHATKTGVWAKIRVLAGQLRYVVAEPINEVFIVDSEHVGLSRPKLPIMSSPKVQFDFTLNSTVSLRRSSHSGTGTLASSLGSSL